LKELAAAPHRVLLVVVVILHGALRIDGRQAWMTGIDAMPAIRNTGAAGGLFPLSSHGNKVARSQV
jgi:hypothetical protein